MNHRHPSRLFLAFVVLCLSAFPTWAEEEIQHLEAHEALEKTIKQMDFGDLEYDKSNIVTMDKNAQVKGLAGLAFVYYRNKTTNERVQLSIQWFETGKDLYEFYAQTRGKDEILKPKTIGEGDDETTILAHEEDDQQLYQWSDGEHFLITIGGAGVPSEMVTFYLEAGSSKVPELEKKLEKEEQDES